MLTFFSVAILEVVQRGPDLSFSRWRRCYKSCGSFLVYLALGSVKAVQCPHPKPKMGDKSQQIPCYSPVSPPPTPGMAADKCITVCEKWQLMSRTTERTPSNWEKGRGDKCCQGPESCLPRARQVLGVSVSEWHIRPWDGCHGAQRQGGVYLCQAPGGMVARGSGCAHCFSPKLGNPGIASVWNWRVVASNTYPPNRLLITTTTRMLLQKSFVFNCRCTGYNITNGADVH